MENKNRRWYDDIMEECELLYCQKDKSMQETCMCWGFECGEGWKDPLRDLSIKLEALNILFYPKYKIRIQADQVKEKFGTLRYYFSIVHDPVGIKGWFYKKLYGIYSSLRKIDYQMKMIVDAEPYTEIKYEEMSEVDWLKHKHLHERCCNVKHYEKDGKFIVETSISHSRKWHHVPTKHRIAYKLIGTVNMLARLFDNRYDDQSKSKSIVAQYMYDAANAYVTDAEKACFERCEDCGIVFDDDHKMCKTNGWITYVCQKCADAKDRQYVLDGAVYQSGKLIQTKEDRDKEFEEIEAKYKKNYAEYMEKEAAFKSELSAAEMRAKENNENT